MNAAASPTDMNVVLVIAFVVALIWLYKLLTPSSTQWKIGNRIPGPKPLPIIGNALELYTKNTFIEALTDVTHKYGSVAKLWLGKQLLVLLTDPSDIEVFLSRTVHLNKSDSYRILDAWLGTKGMLTGDADVWRIHRKLLTPSFHFKILENAVDMIVKHSRILCKQLESEVNGSEFDIADYIEKCSLDIICETSMGVDLQCQTARYSQYLQNIKTLSSMAILRIFSPWLHPEFVFNMSSPGRNYNKALSMVKSHVLKVIMDRKKKLMDKSDSNARSDDAGTKKPKPFLDFVLAESNFTNQEIEDEVQTIMFAGHDTTKTAISFCMYALSQNPHIQDKLIKEIDDTVAKKGDNLTYQDYTSMKYLENVINESLRMYPPVPYIARKVAENITLPSGHTLPTGALANFCLVYVHNDSKHFENPEKFTPERFENPSDRHPFAFLPFSAGSRNCIGQKFAYIEMKIVLAEFFKKYRLLPSIKQKSLTLDTGIVLKSLEGTPVRITLRDSRASSENM